MSKLKAIPATALSLPDIESLVSKVANLKTTRDGIVADAATKQRELDEQLAPIRAAFLPEIERMQESVYQLEKSISASVDQIEKWALVNPDQFQKKRSLELLCGTIGFRLTPPRVEFLTGWKAAMCSLAMAKFTWARNYLNAPTLNREKLLADRNSLKADKLAKVGIRIAQQDEFYVEPKQEHSDTLAGRQVA